MKFPTLYAVSSNGKIKIWNIEAREDAIVISHGYEGGLQQTTTRKVDEKNVGRANATTCSEQAICEARSRWDKKQKQNYVPRTELADSNIEAKHSLDKESPRAWAMLSMEYSKRGHDIQFPCFVQPKIDGIRASFRQSTCGSKGRLYRRGGDRLNHHDAMIEELTRLNVQYALDGEMYSNKIPFEKISGIMNKEKFHDEDEASVLTIQFHIFDCIAPLDFKDRLALLREKFAQNGPFKHIILTETIECQKAENVNEWLHYYVGLGFEGIMLRNFEGGYKGGYRSKNLQKCKLFQDKEFEIIGFKEGKGKYSGCVVWQCKTDQNKTFYVKPACAEEESRELLIDAEKYIGQLLTVKYQETTAKGVPRFPVAKCFAAQK